MSKRKKRNSRRPVNFLGKELPVALSKRVIVFLFGAFFASITVWSLTKSNLSLLVWWHYAIIAGMIILGLFLMIIAIIPRHREVAMSHDHLVEATIRSIFRQLLSRLF